MTKLVAANYGKVRHEFGTFDEVTRSRLLAEFSKTPVENVLEGPITKRGGFLWRVMAHTQEFDPTASMSIEHHNHTNRAEQYPVVIWAQLTLEGMSEVTDIAISDEPVKVLEKVS